MMLKVRAALVPLDDIIVECECGNELEIHQASDNVLSVELCEQCQVTNHDFGWDMGNEHGYDNGYSEGYTEGEQEGHNSGYELGHEEGYVEGYDEGIKDAKEGD